MATRGSYVHNYGNIFGGSPNILVLCNFLNYWWFQTKMIHRAFRTHIQLYKQNPSEKC